MRNAAEIVLFNDSPWWFSWTKFFIVSLQSVDDKKKPDFQEEENNQDDSDLLSNSFAEGKSIKKL